MSYLPDGVLDHLREVAERPDLEGTRYELEAEIGRGGMAAVYAARDTVLGRRVAFKVLDPAERDPEASARLFEEARIVAGLEHPGIVPVYEAGLLADGRMYYAMKLVEGRRLDRFASETPSLAARLRVFQKVCEAVAYAHSRGVIHRDLKPLNIMTGSFGEVLTMDWGVARVTSREEPPGTVAGTPRYMAPEQAAGEPHDHRADIYSLGAILLDLAGTPPPRPLAAIAGRAMAAAPGERYPGALDLAGDVERYLENLPVSAYRENPLEKASRFFARNQTLVLLLLAYVAVRLALFLFRALS
jgi:eukaryotic-like serine/threonine-protein kinase